MSDETAGSICRCGHSGFDVVPNPESGLCMKPTSSLMASLFMPMPIETITIAGCDAEFRKQSTAPRDTLEAMAVAVDEWLARR